MQLCENFSEYSNFRSPQLNRIGHLKIISLFMLFSIGTKFHFKRFSFKYIIFNINWIGRIEKNLYSLILGTNFYSTIWEISRIQENIIIEMILIEAI